MHFQTFQRFHIYIFTLLPFSGIQSGDINSVECNHPHGVCIIKPPSAEIRSTKQGTKGFQKKGRKCVRLFKEVAAVMHEHKFCFNELWIFPLCLGKGKWAHLIRPPCKTSSCLHAGWWKCLKSSLPSGFFCSVILMLPCNVATQSQPEN